MVFTRPALFRVARIVGVAVQGTRLGMGTDCSEDRQVLGSGFCDCAGLDLFLRLQQRERAPPAVRCNWQHPPHQCAA